jgi:hypothetical protein
LLPASRSAPTVGRGYPGAPDVAHDPHVIGPIAAHVVLPWIHLVFSNLKTWALGVYHGLRRKPGGFKLDFGRAVVETPANRLPDNLVAPGLSLIDSSQQELDRAATTASEQDVIVVDLKVAQGPRQTALRQGGDRRS